MPDWDENSAQLTSNLRALLPEIADSAKARDALSVDEARSWQRRMMQGLDVADASYVGAFRGEPGLEDVQVRVGGTFGVSPGLVSTALRAFEKKLQNLVGALDLMVPVGCELDADQLGAVLDVCAWAHAEWVRIHPFANGNGRTARLWANSVAMRYGLPPFVRLRPRPTSHYGDAAAKAMLGDWKRTAVVFRSLLDECLLTKVVPSGGE